MSTEVDLEVRQNGKVIENLSGHKAQEMKGRGNQGEWLKVRYMGRNYKVLGNYAVGLYIDYDKPIPSKVGSRKDMWGETTPKLSGRR